MFDAFDCRNYCIDKKEYQILIDIFTTIVILVKNHFFEN